MATRLAGVAVLLTWAVLGTAAPPASAEPAAAADSCPAVQAIFARGTDDPPGLGPVGQAFVGALRSRIGDTSLAVYPVDYPASSNWSTGIDGVWDATTHIQATAANCPETKMVLGGFSQGAAVMGFVTADAVPDQIDIATAPQPMPLEVSDHVAAVVLLATPSDRIMNFVGEPSVVIGPSYADKTIQLCAPEDPICSEGMNFGVHLGYAENAIVDEGAAYAADRLQDRQPDSGATQGDSRATRDDAGATRGDSGSSQGDVPRR